MSAVEPDRHPVVTRRALLRGSLAGAIALGTPGLLAACGTGATNAPSGAGGAPRRGGNLRAVISGASTTDDVLDPHVSGSWGGGAVAKNVFDKLVAYNNDLTLRPRLAEQLEPNADGTVWRIKLREGVEWHNGKPLIADDVLWSVRRIVDPANKLPAAADLSMVDPAASRRIDDITVELAMKQPLADLGALLAGWYVYIVPDGTNRFDKEHPPVGTGPFRFASWTPGERTRLVRNDNYRANGRPYLDSVEIILATEAAARLNTFLAGEADIVHQLAHTQAKAQQANPQLVIHPSPVGRMQAFNMLIDRKPFDDPRVRDALKLSVDRQAIVDTAYFGYAEIGNDIYGKGAPMYNDTLPQRAYDPDRARALLKQAGQEDLPVTLHTSEVTPGFVEAAVLFAEHAKKAGIKVKVSKSAADSYWSDIYLKQPFTQTGWGNYALEWFFGQALTSDAPSNETAWRRPEWDQRFRIARATMDATLRRQRYLDLQREVWAEGGYIIHSYAKWLDGVSPRVHGFQGATVSSDDWCSYRDVWMA
ncbi:MAG: ABC transporter substrate-binding protein [Haloechinothrix sp.]